MKSAVRNIIILTIIVAIAMLIRMYVIGSYRITGSSMGDTLKGGDFVLVNKTKYPNNQGYNRLLLYKSPLSRDAIKPPLFIGRNIGNPGDVIQTTINGIRINGRLLPDTQSIQPAFRINKNIRESLLQTLESLQIPLRQMKEDSVGIILRMSLQEKELLNHNLSKIIPVDMIEDYATNDEFIIPSKGKNIEMNEIALIIYKEAIMNETDNAAIISDGKLFIHGEEQTFFTFNNNYYWMLSENKTEGIDSRQLGLIPKSHIIGNIWFCWYSKDPAHRFKKIK